MRIRWTTSLLTVVSYAALAVAAHVQVGARARTVLQLPQAGESRIKGDSDSDIIQEEPESSDPKERKARRAKNVRYNIGGRNLTTLNPDVESFIEQVWPRGELVPASESAVVVTGTVVRVQPYLSGDRSRIYTEITVQVEDVLKRDRNGLPSAPKTVVIDRLGGALKLGSGRVVRDDIQIDNLGKTLPGKRYMFFADRVNKGSDISLIKSYELRDGKVFTNDSRPSRLISTLPGVPQAWADEAAFLKAVRRVTASTVGTAARKR
jgi:hypothetical protein